MQVPHTATLAMRGSRPRASPRAPSSRSRDLATLPKVAASPPAARSAVCACAPRQTWQAQLSQAITTCVCGVTTIPCLPKSTPPRAAGFLPRCRRRPPRRPPAAPPSAYALQSQGLLARVLPVTPGVYVQQRRASPLAARSALCVCAPESGPARTVLLVIPGMYVQQRRRHAAERDRLAVRRALHCLRPRTTSGD